MPGINRSKKEAKDFKAKSLTGRVAAIGTNFIAGVGVLGYLGHLLDKKFGNEYLFMAIGAFLGIVWAMYEAIKIALMMSREEDTRKGENNGA
jgi:F0F1-type ATP synthase assembly protein I